MRLRIERENKRERERKEERSDLSQFLILIFDFVFHSSIKIF
jgi:hypothetical protein